LLPFCPRSEIKYKRINVVANFVVLLTSLTCQMYDYIRMYDAVRIISSK